MAQFQTSSCLSDGSRYSEEKYKLHDVFALTSTITSINGHTKLQGKQNSLLIGAFYIEIIYNICDLLDKTIENGVFLSNKNEHSI